MKYMTDGPFIEANEQLVGYLTVVDTAGAGDTLVGALRHLVRREAATPLTAQRLSDSGT
jgi:hypothetical protein